VTLLTALQRSNAAAHKRQQQQQQQQRQVANKLKASTADSTGCGSKAAAAAAAPEMTAKAAAMFKSVAASVGAALQQDETAVDAGPSMNPSPQCSGVPTVRQNEDRVWTLAD
jgi:hypothetical protein